MANEIGQDGKIKLYQFHNGCIMNNRFYPITKSDIDTIKNPSGPSIPDDTGLNDVLRMATYNYGKVTTLVNTGDLTTPHLVKLEDGTYKTNPLLSDNTMINARGFAMTTVYRKLGLEYPDLIPQGNPTGQSAAAAIRHAVMGVFARYDFYLYILSKGYIYSNNHSPSTLPTNENNQSFSTPQSWMNKVEDLVSFGSYPPPQGASGRFTIPITGFTVEANCLYHPCGEGEPGNPFDNTPLLKVGQPQVTTPGSDPFSIKKNGLHLYGTSYSPVANHLDRQDQEDLKQLGKQQFLYMVTMGGGKYQDISEQAVLDWISQYSPLDAWYAKPSWCNEWSSFHDSNTVAAPQLTFGDSDAFEGTNFTEFAPVYQADLNISLNLFFDYLIQSGIIESNPDQAQKNIENIINAPEDEGGVAGLLDLVLIPGGGEQTTGYGTGGLGFGGLGGLFGAGNEDLSFSPFQEAIIQEVLKQAPTEEDIYEIGEVFNNSTHYINNEVNKVTIKNKLLVPNSTVYEYTKYAKDGMARVQRVRAYRKDKMTSFLLPFGTTVQVIEEFIPGDDGLYHKVRVADPGHMKFGSKEVFYIKAKLLDKLDGVAPSMNTIFNNYVKKKEKTEWINMKDEEIFFDRNLLAYSIVIEPIDSTTGKKIESMLKCSETIEILEMNAMRSGIQALLHCHNKAAFINNSMSQTVDHLLNKVFQFAYTGDSIVNLNKGLNWYLDPRPRSKVRFIVRIPAKYFDAIPQKVETFEDIPHFDKKLYPPNGNQPIDSSPVPSGGVSDFRITSLLTCNIKHKIDLATSIMEKYKDQIDAWDGEVEGLDLGLEIQRLKAFPQVMKKFVVENKVGYTEGSEDELEIGCNSKFRLKYVSYVKAGLSKPLRICFNRFKRKPPVKYSRTMAYIYYLDEIVELERKSISGASNQQQMNWVEFVQRYTYPMPAIRPSSRKRTNPLSSNLLTDGKENKAEKLSQKFDKQIQLTAKGLDAQRLEISKPDLKLQLASSRLDHKDFSGDLFVEQIPQLVDQIRDLSPSFDGLQDLFTLVFDKIDISALSSISAGSLAFDMPTIDVEGAFALASIDSPEISGLQFDKIFDFLPEVSIEKIKKIESYFDGSISISDLEGEFSDEMFSTILSFYETKEEKIVPSGREADIMKNGSLEDIKCLGLDAKYGTTSPRLSESQNVRKELVKIVVPANDLATAIGKVTPDIISAMGEVGKLGSMDVPSLSLSPLKKAAVKFPSPPTLTIPRLPDIDDTMPNISKDLTSGLEEVLATVLIEISAVLLESVFNSVFSSAQKLGQNGVDAFPSEFGGQDMNELLEDFKPQNQDAVENALKKLGIGPSTEDYDIPIDSLIEDLAEGNEGGDSTTQTTDKNSRQLITEISSVLTPLEVVDLLEGNPSTETIKIVEAVMGEGNQVFLDSINRVTSVKQLFKSLGKLADSNKLEAIRNTVDQILPNPSGLLCEYENFSSIGENDSPGDVIRRRALEGKLDKECVETQMSEIRKRKTKRLANLLALASGKDILSGLIPPAIGSCGKGIINKNHQTVEHMNEKLINAIFNPVKMNFSTEANSIAAAYTENTMRPPTQYDDQYDALKAALANAGIEDINSSEDVKPDFIQSGFAQEFAPQDEDGDPSKQQKFNNAAAPFQVIDGTIAPKVRTHYVTNIAGEAPGAGGGEKITNIVSLYDKTTLSAELADYEEAKSKLDSKIAELKNLELKKLQGFGNEGELDEQIEQIKGELGDRDSENLLTLFGAYNYHLENIKPAAPNPQEAPGTVVTKTAATFNYYSKDTDTIDDSSNYKILDTWRLFFYPGTEKIMQFPMKASKYAGYTIRGYQNIDEMVLDETSDYEYYPEYNERDQVFSNYMKKKWEEIIPSPVIDFLPEEGGFNHYYRDKRWKVFTSLINVFASFGYNSKAYSSSGIQNLQLGAGKSDANFDVNDQCATPKTDNLLGIEDLKRQAREEYNNACEESNDPSKPSGLEKANLRSLMRATIRTSILDSVSRSIFISTIFSMEELFSDPMLSDFMTHMVKGDLEAQEQEYYAEFLVQSKEMTSEKQRRGEKLIDPFTGIEDEKLLDEANPRTASGENSLRLLIREEMKYLAPKIDERIKPKYKSIDKFFLDKMVPNVHIRRHFEETQYYQVVTEKIDDPTPSDLDFVMPTKFKLRNDFKFIDTNSPVYNGAGGFVLEKYIRVTDKQKSNSELEAMPKAKKDFLEKWYSRPGGANNEFPEILANQSVDIGNDKEGSYAYTSGAVNVKAFIEAIQVAMEGSDIDEINISDMINEFQFGVRLVYVPPSDDGKTFKGVEQSYIDETLADFTPIWNPNSAIGAALYAGELEQAFQDAESMLLQGLGFGQIYIKDIDSDDGPAAKAAAMKQTAQKEKLFRVREKFATFDAEFGTTIQGDVEQTTIEIEQDVVVKTLYPIEVVKAEADYNFLGILQNADGTTSLSALIDALQDGILIGGIFNGLKQKIVNDEKYKFMFHYDIPLKRALALVYIQQHVASTANYPSVTRNYSITKDMLRSSFFNMIPGDPWWSKQDKRIEDQGGNAGMMETANNTMTSEGPSGSDIAMKIAFMAASIICKAMAAQQDPHYGLMKQLDNFNLTPYGMNWKSVPILYPVNFPLPFPPFMGWGPPMTPLGMVAYTLPMLPGESKKNKNNQQEETEC